MNRADGEDGKGGDAREGKNRFLSLLVYSSIAVYLDLGYNCFLYKGVYSWQRKGAERRSSSRVQRARKSIGQ